MEEFNISFANEKASFSNNIVYTSDFTITINKKELFVNSELILSSGNKYGLIGKNGCGKTTLLNAIKNNLLPIKEKSIVLYVEQEISECDNSPLKILLSSNGKYFKLNKRMSEIEDLLSDENFNDDEIMEEYTTIQEKLDTYNYEKEVSIVKKILFGLGFTQNMQEEPINILSGGWKMRVSLAKALYLEPDLLLLDEPTNHLDLEATIWLGNYLYDKFSKDKTVLLVSHNVGFLNNVCDRILNIEDNKLITYKGDYTTFKYNYNKKIKNLEKEWGKLLKRKKKMNKKEFDELLKTSDIKEPPKPYNVKINFPEPARPKSNLVSVESVSFSYNDEKSIFENVDFGVDIDSKITLIGKNGTGKTTLLQLLTGNLQPVKGTIITKSNLKLGYYHQHFENFLPKDKSPIEFLENIIPDDLVEGNRTQTIRKYLGGIKLEGSAHNSKIESLSGGQKARVALVYLIFQKPQLILFDEPTNHLDIETVEALIEGLTNYDGGVVIVTHDSELITKLDTQLWLLKDNKISFYKNSFEDYCNEIIDNSL